MMASLYQSASWGACKLFSLRFPRGTGDCKQGSLESIKLAAFSGKLLDVANMERSHAAGERFARGLVPGVGVSLWISRCEQSPDARAFSVGNLFPIQSHQDGIAGYLLQNQHRVRSSYQAVTVVLFACFIAGAIYEVQSSGLDCGSGQSRQR